MGDGAEGARRRSIGGPSHCTSDLVLKSMSRRLAFVDDRSLMDTINRRGVSAAENSRARPRSRWFGGERGSGSSEIDRWDGYDRWIEGLMEAGVAAVIRSRRPLLEELPRLWVSEMIEIVEGFRDEIVKKRRRKGLQEEIDRRS